jgi:hypothetical protein
VEVGDNEGASVTGEAEGADVGDCVGTAEGFVVGELLGAEEGFTEGECDGDNDGLCVGDTLTDGESVSPVPVGEEDGATDGFNTCVGASVSLVGEFVG